MRFGKKLSQAWVSRFSPDVVKPLFQQLGFCLLQAISKSYFVEAPGSDS